ncbi:hypothetical protein [Microbacterium maritypicum]|uniref:Uncharacterized protein n=1 Tax=Microbacterium maritypicum MF109 TaxID=1333857 RepID=T5KI88_MICMQ|nr:hypothetical protein [Microbacterium liquefaciens]EQM83393.1 hypothetical protein L687_12295 [Microbacterium maritypicum MF109]
MNVKQEIRDADRRIQEQINVSARAALVRIGVDVDAMDREEAEKRARVARESFAAFGAAVGFALNTLIEFSTAFVSGFEAAMTTEVEELDR